jgi:FkbM family methyltransferase
VRFPDPTGEAEALLNSLGSLPGERPEAARLREGRLLAELAEQPDMPVVLYGAGNLGRRTQVLLRGVGREIAAFIDNDPSQWGTSIEGAPVLSPDDASSRFAANGQAIVTIWRAEGGHDFRATRRDLQKRGWCRVASFIPLYWGIGAGAIPYFAIDRPSIVLEARAEVLEAAGLWADQASLREFVGQVRWRLTGDFDALSPTVPDQYFADGIVQASREEVFVDCGAFTGDTLIDVARRLGSWRAYHAFEPDPESFAALQAAVGRLPVGLAERVYLHQAATADRPYRAQFAATGLASAKLAGGGGFEVDCVAIDDVLAGELPTFVKMDIEGGEAAALTGANRSIRGAQPLLAISAYHKQADLWTLALQVHSVVPEYRLFLVPHAAEGFDTVLYAVPSNRLAGALASAG